MIKKNLISEGEKKEMDIWKVKDKEVTFNYSSTNNNKRNRTK
jgi:hypothetical protein